MNLFDLLIQRLVELYTPPAIPGSLQLETRGRPDLSCHVQMGEALIATPGEILPSDARIELTVNALEYMLANADVLDLRVSPLVQVVNTGGSELIVQHFEQLLKRPGERVRKVVEQLATRPIGSCDAIIETLTADPALAIMAMTDSRPVCFRKVIRSEVTNWGLDELNERFGETPLRKSPATGRTETFGDFIAACRAMDDGRIYTSGCAIPPSLDQHLIFPFLRPTDYSASRLWFGRRCDGLITRLHRDFANSFLGHIFGIKRMYLYHPDQVGVLYMNPAYNTYQISRADPVARDLERFPLLAQVRPLTIDLEPGDLLVIPTGWFHCVAAPTDVLSVSRFIEDEDLPRLVEELNVDAISTQAGGSHLASRA